MGVLVEFHVQSSVYFLLAEYPKEWNDVKHMQVEATVKAATPEELYHRILAVQPYTGCGFLRAARRDEIMVGDGTGVFRFADPSVLATMPLWKWNDLVCFSKVLSSK